MIVSSGVPVESDVAVLRRIVKRERRAWHLSAFAEFVQARRGSGWLTAPMPVSPEDVGHCVAMACARARWTRARTIALWAVRALERAVVRDARRTHKLGPCDLVDVPPGACWQDHDASQSVACRWPSVNRDGDDCGYCSRPMQRHPHSLASPRVTLLAVGLTADECEWVQTDNNSNVIRRRAEHLQAGGTIESWPGDES